MASNTYNLNTWSAKRIFGDASITNNTDALLQLTNNNSWLLNSGRSSVYGIKYVYDSSTNGTKDKIEFYGGYKVNSTDTPTVWARLDTGDVYILGKVGIEYDPNTTNNSYKLYVNGDTYISGKTYFDDYVGIDYDPATSGNTYKLYVSGDTYISNNLTLAGDGIYYKGDLATHRMIRWINNTSDINGNGISIGGGGLSILGSGESSDTLISNLSLATAGGTETTYIASDGSILFYPEQNTYDASAIIEMTAGKIFAGILGDTTRQTEIGVQSGSGKMYMWAHAAANGQRGIWTPATTNGGPAKAVFSVDQYNNIYIPLGNTNGNGYIYRKSRSVSWYQGRDTAMIRTTSYNGYDAILSMKTTDGDWSLGVYTNNIAYLTYIIDTNYSDDTNTITKQFAFKPDGTIVGDAFSGNAASSTSAKWLMNRGGTTVTIADSTWAVQVIPTGYTNRATVWHQKWTQSGLTYTPSGGSATTITDSGDLKLWLSSSNTTNALILNMQIDGMIYAGGGFKGNVTGNCSGTAAALKDKTNGTASYLNYGRSGITAASGFTWFAVWESTYSVGPASKAAVAAAVQASASGSWGISVTGSSASCTGNAATASITTHASIAASYNNAINNALVRDTGGHSGYHAVVAIKTKNAFWSIGNHSNSSTSSDDFLIAYGQSSFKGFRLKPTGVTSASGGDFAEYRKCDIIEPGRVVTETGDDGLTLCQDRLAPATKVISDTYGSSVGECRDRQTPVAVSGRVLVYPYKDRSLYKPGDAVCSAPGGTVDIMTRDEIIQYPDRIVGIVSDIPSYDVWYMNASDNDQIPINGRIWIYVR